MEHSELSYTELSSVAGAARGAEEGLNWPESLDNEIMAFRNAGLRGTWPWKDIHCVWLGVASMATQTAATKR